MPRGLFVVLEGGDYSGKGTQAVKLAEHILNLSEDNDVLITHEPTWRAKEIKRRLAEDESAYSDAEKMAGVYVEDRRIHSRDIIDPNLDNGVIVIGNRYYLSTLFYQSIQGVSLSRLVDMHMHPEILTPDLTLLLDITPKTGDKRAEKRERAPEKKFERKMFRDLVYQKYLEIIHSEKYRGIFDPIEIINGNESADEVFNNIKNVFNPVYEKWRESR